MVVSALEVLSSSNNENGGVYDFWFKSFEQTLSGRGKMGSLVGASEDVKKAGGIDTNLNDYAVGIAIVRSCNTNSCLLHSSSFRISFLSLVSSISSKI